MRYVIIPGINGSGPQHWQTFWQEQWGPSASRISPESWDSPDLADWCEALDRVTRQCDDEAVLIAHSLGCLAAAFWLRQRRPGVSGAFLVAPPDPAGSAFPADAAPSFTTIKPATVTVPALVVGSDDDPYCGPDEARKLAAQWDAGYVSVGPAGHINDASGLGAWESGQALLSAFTVGLGLACPGAPGLELQSRMSTPPDGLPAYRVLTGPDDASFCHRVSEALALGYRLHEGPALTYNGNEVIVAQALLWPGATE